MTKARENELAVSRMESMASRMTMSAVKSKDTHSPRNSAASFLAVAMVLRWSFAVNSGCLL